MAGVGARAISSSSLSLSLSLSNSAFSSSRSSLSLLGRCCCPSALLSLPIIPSPSSFPSPFPAPSACHLPRLPVASPMRTLSTLASTSLGLTAPSEPLLAEVDLCMSDINLMEWKGDILAVGVLTSDLSKDESGAFENTILRKLDGSLGGLLGAVVTEEDFSGKTGQSTFIRIPGSSFKRVGLIGLGKSDIISRQGVWKSFGEVVAGAIKTAQASSVAISVASNEELDSESAKARASSIAAGVVLGLHEDLRFKSETKKPSLKRLEFLGMGSNGLEIEETLKKTQKVCAGVILTRHLINAPPNVITPNALADEALNLASDFSDVLTTQIFDEEKCKELKMGAYLGVAAASDNPPKFIHMQYKPPHGDIQKKIAIIGKGLTFDSGGYNIKSGPGSMIELMKFDMGGAGAVFGAAKAIAAIRPLGVEVHFIVAACENMIGGKGMRPGDILTASNGKTIEVNNTDAEGRLTLADALVYACNQGVDKIVDLATLTGACIVGLGNDIAGLFTPNDDMANDLSKASMDAGEKLWRLPMEEAYWDMMKSGIADMVNTGGRAGGSITAALFLKQFVDPKVKWAHLDIAGPVWSEKKKSATGFGVATLVEWILAHAST